MQEQAQTFPHRVDGSQSNSSSMPCEAKSMINSYSASPPRTPYYTQEHEKPNTENNLRPLPQMPSESTTAVRHVAFDHAGHEHGQTGTFRESPAVNQSRWPTLDLLLNPTDDQPSNTCDVPNKSHL